LVDECIFSVKTYKPLAWAAKGRNVTQTQRLDAQRCVAVVAAVSAEGGLILFERRPSSFNGYQFSQFMERLSAVMAHRPLTVLLDNCKIHNTDSCQEVYAERAIDVLWNVPYRPDLNGIEFVWAIAKRSFRQLQLQRMVGTLVETFEQCVDRAMAAPTRE
jgi:hypothetical protein